MLARALLALILVLTAACGRPLAPAERAFTATVLGPGLDADRVRIVRGNLIGGLRYIRPTRPREACREKILPPPAGPTVTVSTAAFVLGETVFYRRDLWAPDLVAGYPRTLPLADAMLLAHELTHVWQWQNRETTGFSPMRVAAEQAADDPYLFVLDDRPFAAYGYEQQASLVEEYVCCRALDPEGARTGRLRALLEPVFPGLEARETAMSVAIPWKDAPVRGICS
ncbi:hypothetical protein DXV76_09190 [Rhodobacteraceae bacterium CCMM004]|nr:hypothetical protein DXV76_09190 [Rhodobacteraceae bacterium CCMM004]